MMWRQNDTSKTTHLLITTVLNSTFQTSLANFRLATFVRTVMNKLHVGFGGNREELKGTQENRGE